MTGKSESREFTIKKSWWLWVIIVVIVVALAQAVFYGDSKKELEAYIRNSKDTTLKIDNEYLKLQAGMKEMPGNGYVLGKNDARQAADDLFYREDISFTKIGGTFSSNEISRCAEIIHYDHLAQIKKLRVFSEKAVVDPAEFKMAHESLQASLDIGSACLAKFNEQHEEKSVSRSISMPK